MPKSRLVKINDYALIEITYEDKALNTNDIGFTLVNNTIQGYLQVLNDNRSELSTGNVLDRSSVQIGTNQWVRTEQDVPIPYLSTDPRFEVTSLRNEAPTLQWNVTYDRIRVHILSGYTFTAASGFVLDVSYPETNSTKSTRISLETYVNGDDYIVFNTRPLVINGTNYDKYIEFFIPSLADMITEFDAAVDKQDALAYYLTSDNQGFLTEGLIKFDFYEITEVNNINGYDYLTTGVPSYVSIEPQDQFSNLAAVIRQQGDYFEYYPTWDDAFIADYIAILNETRGAYVVIHELTVSEQVGFSQLYSSSNVVLQTADFDQPSLFKPILKNADTAFSFSIDYTMRLTNETDGSQIIRTASVTSFEPKRFGKNATKLNVRGDVIPYRVYNKVTNGPVFNLPVPKQDIRVQRIIAPSFYENNNVSVSTGKLFIDKAGQFIPEDLFEWDIIFGQTEAIVLVTPFDNYFRFNVFRVTPDSIETLDLSSAQEIDIVFETTSGKKYRYSLYQPFPTNETAITNQINDPKSGKLIFRMPASDSVRMMDDLPGKFYITVRNQNIVRARVSLDIASDLRGREVTISFADWSQKTKDDLITVYNNLKPYTIEKRYLEVIEVIPDGLTGEETVVYKGNVDTIDNYQTALDKIDELRNNSFLVRLNSVKERESELDNLTRQLNTRESQLNAKESSLKSLETALLGQQQTIEQQTGALQDKQTELDRRNALLKQREEELQRLMEESKKNQSSSVKELADIIKSLREEIERLSKVNQGTQGSTSTGSGASSGTGTGTQGVTGTKKTTLNTDVLINQTNIWQDPFAKGGFADFGTVMQSNESPKTTNVYYDVYYVNTFAFVGRYEIRSFSYSSLTVEQKKQLFDKEFVNDPRTNGGKYTELKRAQARTFQAGETSYNSKWFTEKQTTSIDRGNQSGSMTNLRSNGLEFQNSGFSTVANNSTVSKIAVLEFPTSGFSTVANNPTVSTHLAPSFAGNSVLTTYTRRVGSLTTFRVEVALDDSYQQGKADVAAGKNTFLAGYSKYVDRLTKSTYEKQIPSVTNISSSPANSKTYLYNQKTKYVNSLLGEMSDTNVQIGFNIAYILEQNLVNVGFGKESFVGWNSIFEILSRNQGAGDFRYTVSPLDQVNDWQITLAKFYDDLLLSLFAAKTNNNQIKDTSVITNLILLQSQTPAPKEETVKYVRVLKTSTLSDRKLSTAAIRNPLDPNPVETATTSAYMVKSVAADFVNLPQHQVLGEEFVKVIPSVLTATISGINYTYDKKDPYQVSDWISGFIPGFISKTWKN
jgi:hypothetical protein